MVESMNDHAGTDRRGLSRNPRPGRITAVLALASMSGAFMQTIIVPIQARLPVIFDASRDDTAWVVTVTLLSGCIVTPIAGRLGDLYGKRRIALVLLIILVVGSVIAALPTGLPGLLLGRALQGAAMGLTPLGISILRDVLHPDRLGTAVALVSATLGIGGVLGLPLSAFVIEHVDWHGVFWLSGGLGVLNILLVRTLVPVSTLRRSGRFDFVGAVGLGIGLGGVLLAISRGNVWGWTAPLTIGCAAGGFAVLVLWGRYQLWMTSPLVDLRVAARPAVLFTNLASIAMGFAFFSSQIAFPQMLELPQSTEVGLGMNLLGASLVLVPAGGLMMLISPFAGALNRIFGAQVMFAAGALALVAAYITSLFATSEVWHILLINCIIGVGIGLGFAAMPTLIMRAVPDTETAAANGLNTLMRTLGSALAAASISAVLAHLSVPIDGVQVPTPEGFRISFLISAAVALLCAVLALVPHPAHPADERHAELP
jgi:MFS family permease